MLKKFSSAFKCRSTTFLKPFTVCKRSQTCFEHIPTFYTNYAVLLTIANVYELEHFTKSTLHTRTSDHSDLKCQLSCLLRYWNFSVPPASRIQPLQSAMTSGDSWVNLVSIARNLKLRSRPYCSHYEKSPRWCMCVRAVRGEGAAIIYIERREEVRRYLCETGTFLLRSLGALTQLNDHRSNDPLLSQGRRSRKERNRRREVRSRTIVVANCVMCRLDQLTGGNWSWMWSRLFFPPVCNVVKRMNFTPRANRKVNTFVVTGTSESMVFTIWRCRW